MKGIRQRASALFEKLENGEWENWILFMLEAIEQTANGARSRVLGIREALRNAVEKARSEMGKGYSKELIELIYQQPYTRIASLEQAGIAKRDTAAAYLKRLEEIGMLRSIRLGRDRFYLNDQLLKALTS